MSRSSNLSSDFVGAFLIVFSLAILATAIKGIFGILLAAIIFCAAWIILVRAAPCESTPRVAEPAAQQ